jgi:predicted nuclease of restriction endonuclease-like RecB superfamily
MSNSEPKSSNTPTTDNNSKTIITTPTTATATATASNYRLPTDITLQHSSKLAIVEDKPIMLDYWTQSLEKKVLVGVRESGEKLLVKSAEEYTSAISKFYKSATEYIVVTENSIYIVSSDIPSRRIS